MVTNWEKYFGTPEKTTESLEDMGGLCPLKAFNHIDHCCDCPGDDVSCYGYIVKWLQEECNE